MELLIYILTAYGITNILVFTAGPFKLIEWLRNKTNSLGGMLDCPICTSFWIGLILSLIDLMWGNVPFTPFALILGHNMGLIQPIFDGFFTSGAVWLIHTLQERLEKR